MAERAVPRKRQRQPKSSVQLHLAGAEPDAAIPSPAIEMPDDDTPRDDGPVPPFLEMVRKAGLTELREGATLADVSRCLGVLAASFAQADAATAALAREAAIKAVKATSAVDGPAKLVDAFLPPTRSRPTDGDKQGGAVLFPSPNPWPEPVATADLLEELTNAVSRYVVVPHDMAAAIALWVLHTHTLDAAQITPRLAILSPLKRCGKSTLLKLLGKLVRYALPTANLTAASFFRIVERHAPTLLIDEADTFLAEKEELRGILNAGHDRESARVVRCVGDDHEPRAFAVWAPVAIAAIGRIPDTLTDRSIVVTMRRKTPGESVAPFRRREWGPVADLRRKCESWAADVLPMLRDAKPTTPEALNDRAADNWEPLLAIADAGGEAWGVRARSLALALAGDGETTEAATLGEALLGDVRALFDARGVDRFATALLLAELTKMEGRPWAHASNGGPLTAHHLGGLLARFDISSGTIRLADGSTPKGYRRESFADAWSRYLRAPGPASATSATPA